MCPGLFCLLAHDPAGEEVKLLTVLMMSEGWERRRRNNGRSASSPRQIIVTTAVGFHWQLFGSKCRSRPYHQTKTYLINEFLHSLPPTVLSHQLNDSWTVSHTTTYSYTLAYYDAALLGPAAASSTPARRYKSAHVSSVSERFIWHSCSSK